MNDTATTNGAATVTTKAQFKAALIAELTARDGVAPDEKAVVSALAKTIRHMQAKWCETNWTQEHAEGGCGDAVCFYDESKAAVVTTFNRNARKGN